MSVFGGVFSVLPTPFDPAGDCDFESLKRVIDLFLDDGVNGFTALGVTSEVARLTDAERDCVLDIVLTHVNGRVPVVAGATADGLHPCLEQTLDFDVRIFGGLGGVFLLEELMAGAAGAMTGFAFPAILVQVVQLFREGQIEEAADVFYRKVALMRFEFQEGIGMAIRKEVLRRRGAIAHAAIRAPGATLDQTTRDALERVMQWTLD